MTCASATANILTPLLEASSTNEILATTSIEITPRAPLVFSGKNAASVPVLLYHGEGSMSNEMPISVFADQMKNLRGAGWQSITMQQFADFMQGKISLPDKSLLLTFDDGRTDTFNAADPILKDMGLHAVMFVITGFSMPGNGNKSIGSFYLNKAQLKAMADSGRWDLESHGNMDHYIYGIASTTSGQATTTIITYNSTPPANTTGGRFLSNKFIVTDPTTGQNRFETDAEFTARVQNDLATAKQTLENDFGLPITGFAYPYNDFGQDSLNFASSTEILDTIVPSLYPFAFYQVAPSEMEKFNYPFDPSLSPAQYKVRRIEPPTNESGAELLGTLEISRNKELPYRTSVFDDSWLSNWGIATTTTDDMLLLSATASTTGAESFLSGSGKWTNYTYTVNANVTNGSDLTLVGRYHDAQNYLSCGYAGSWLGIQERLDGVQKTVASGTSNFIRQTATKANLTVTMTVQGNKISCMGTAGEQPLTYTITDPRLMQGGIGLATWNVSPGVAAVEVRTVNAENL